MALYGKKYYEDWDKEIKEYKSSAYDSFSFPLDFSFSGCPLNHIGFILIPTYLTVRFYSFPVQF